jgi:radical SAM superfamily enzyme YgiQ (UPF0313 family)
MDLLLAHGYFLCEDAAERRVMKPYPPLGLLYVAGHLRARGFGVHVFDSTFARFEDFSGLLARERPPVVGLYCNLMTKAAVLRLIAACRTHGALVVLGGPEPPHEAETWLDHGADAVVIGEGELTLEELLPRALRSPGMRDWSEVAGLVYRDEHGRARRTAPRALIRDLDAQPWPARDLIDLGPYLGAWRERHGHGSLSLLTARGCPYTCRWCSRSVFGESHRRRSPQNVADEVAHLRGAYAPEQLWYVDDVFTIHKGWTLQYAAELKRRGLRLPFECISRAERIDAEIADALRDLGCRRLWIGSESGSQRILDRMDRRVKVEQVQHATRLLKQRGIEVGMFIMLGYEGEERQDLEATARHLKLSDPVVFLSTVSYPIKGTPYHAELAARLHAPGVWETRTDRELVVRGRRTPLYYRFARTWLHAEVARHRHWRHGRLLRAARAALLAGGGRLGMALTEGRRVS